MISDLFLIPFLTGLGLAVLLPLLGCYLRLRDEWLAALAYSHVAAAGALLALVGGLPPALGGIAAAGLAGTGKRLFAARLAGGAAYALLLLGGWAVSVLMAANQPMAERLVMRCSTGNCISPAATSCGWWRSVCRPPCWSCAGCRRICCSPIRIRISFASAACAPGRRRSVSTCSPPWRLPWRR